MQYTCGKCREVFTVGEEMRGQVYTCGNCGARMNIPAPAPRAEGDALERLAQAAEQRPPGAVPPPQTSPYGAPPAYQPARPNAPTAVASLVLGIIGVCCCGIIFGTIAIVQANTARRLIRLYPGRYACEGLATAGLVLGIIAVVKGVVEVLAVFFQIAMFVGMASIGPMMGSVAGVHGI